MEQNYWQWRRNQEDVRPTSLVDQLRARPEGRGAVLALASAVT
ncbi:MAG: hypothetical protein ACI90M_000714, partial [Candidatus Azotimanducaceae bacterium]